MPKIVFTLNSYLQKLRDISPESVPSSNELANAIGVDPTTLSRIAQNRTTGIRKEHLAGLIHELRKCGFDTTPNDLLLWVEEKDTTPCD